MNASVLADISPLPEPVVALLDAFLAGHPGAELRVWAESEQDAVCLYPDGDASPEPWETQRRHIDHTEAPPLLLEVRGLEEMPELSEYLMMALSQVLHHEREARSAARELTERYEEINLLYFISEILASVLSVPDAATRILAEVADVLGARRAALWVYSADDRRLHLAAAVGEDGLKGPIEADNPESATAWVFRERQPLNLERGAVLPDVPRLEQRPSSREAFLSVPINYTPPAGTTRTVGVITLVGRRSNVRFSAGDARLLAAIASQIGAALETQRLVRESLRQERLMRELELAHDLQLKLLPDLDAFDPPPYLAARCLPADSVGGDFYHLFRLRNDRFGIMIGDVSSHGFSAALIMALTMSAIAIYAQESGPPAGVLRGVHDALIKELESTEMYLTLFYGVLDPAAGRLVYANAGHPHAFHVAEDGTCTRLGATSPPLGIAPADSFGEAEVSWGGGRDLVCLLTDGLTDVYPDRGDGPGEQSLIGEVIRIRDRPLDEILDVLFSAPKTEGIPSDDRTALLVRG